MKICRVCLLEPVQTMDRCGTCYVFLWRNGYDRPEGLILRSRLRAQAKAEVVALLHR